MVVVLFVVIGSSGDSGGNGKANYDRQPVAIAKK
jgi:hypothetical protein